MKGIRKWVFMGLLLSLFWAVSPVTGIEKHWEAPKEEAKKKNPVSSTKESIEAGKKLYNQYCSMCHGATGKGDGPAAAALKPKPADFSDPKMMAHETDGSLFYKISKGRGPMPGWEKSINEKDRWNLVNFIRTFSTKGK